VGAARFIRAERLVGLGGHSDGLAAENELLHTGGGDTGQSESAGQQQELVLAVAAALLPLDLVDDLAEVGVVLELRHDDLSSILSLASPLMARLEETIHYMCININIR
jgi:hypothetical protein